MTSLLTELIKLGRATIRTLTHGRETDRILWLGIVFFALALALAAYWYEMDREASIASVAVRASALIVVSVSAAVLAPLMIGLFEKIRVELKRMDQRLLFALLLAASHLRAAAFDCRIRIVVPAVRGSGHASGLLQEGDCRAALVLRDAFEAAGFTRVGIATDVEDITATVPPRVIVLLGGGRNREVVNLSRASHAISPVILQYIRDTERAAETPVRLDGGMERLLFAKVQSGETVLFVIAGLTQVGTLIAAEFFVRHFARIAIWKDNSSNRRVGGSSAFAALVAARWAGNRQLVKLNVRAVRVP